MVEDEPINHCLLYTKTSGNSFFCRKCDLQELQEFRNLSDNIKDFWQWFYNGHLREQGVLSSWSYDGFIGGFYTDIILNNLDNILKIRIMERYLKYV